MAPEQVMILLYYLIYLCVFCIINSVLVVFNLNLGTKPSCLKFPDMTAYKDNLILERVVYKRNGLI